MKHHSYILMFLFCLCSFYASAQLSNRQKIIGMILHEPKFKAPEPGISGEALVVTPATSIMLIPAQSQVPRYSLPKGNVFCRLEDYVQMHTPMKLNIGLAGQ